MLKHFHTIRHLKPTQICYRLYYALRSRLRGMTGHKYQLSIPALGYPVEVAGSIPAQTSWLGGRRFRFLNLEHDFGKGTDWNFTGLGKLWAYNLNYFEFLLQPDMTRENGLDLIHEFMVWAEQNREGMEPYPTSLRIMNWIKFISRHKVHDEGIDASLYAQLQILVDNLEYHILGNHLLENGFALLFGAVYFQDKDLLNAARGILEPELEEQILSDGAHFELSPMYHQIVLFRVLDCINLLQANAGQVANNFHANGLESILKTKAVLMLGWLEQITFSSGDIPLFNDAAPGIAPTSWELMEYAKKLGLQPDAVSLSQSGYRKFTGDNYELIVDAGPIGPDYIPGHGHCDMLSFVLYVHGKPCIVDTGTSTYATGERRQFERSTSAHNTVGVEDMEQSQVWAGFRVARRARIRILEEDSYILKAEYDGFKIRHRRSFWTKQEAVEIKDEHLTSGGGIARFHLASETKAEIQGDIVRVTGLKMSFKGYNKIWIEPYDLAQGFNKRAEAKCICVGFADGLQTRMEFIK